MKKILATLVFLSGSIFAATFNAYTAHLPPFTLSMEDKGISHELVEELAKRTGHTINIKYLPWKRAQLTAQKDPMGLAFSMSRSKSREDKYTWVVELMQAGYTFVTKTKPINTFDEAKKAKKIVVLSGTPREKNLKKENFTNFEGKSDTTTAAKFLNAGRADAWYTIDARAKYVFKSLGFDQSKLIIGTPTKISHMWLGGNKAIDKSVIKDFEKAMAEIKADGTYDSIMKKYLGE